MIIKVDILGYLNVCINPFFLLQNHVTWHNLILIYLSSYVFCVRSD